jgi:hypothetical protein
MVQSEGHAKRVQSTPGKLRQGSRPVLPVHPTRILVVRPLFRIEVNASARQAILVRTVDHVCQSLRTHTRLVQADIKTRQYLVLRIRERYTARPGPMSSIACANQVTKVPTEDLVWSVQQNRGKPAGATQPARASVRPSQKHSDAMGRAAILAAFHNTNVSVRKATLGEDVFWNHRSTEQERHVRHVSAQATDR